MLTHPTLRLHVLNSTFVEGCWELRITARMSGVGKGSGWMDQERRVQKQAGVTR
jgi:hypothetical protein